MTDFAQFPKIPRLSRNCVVTEKIDGTNGQVHIRLMDDPETGAQREQLEFGIDTQIRVTIVVDGKFWSVPAFIRAGSRNRWLGQSKATDNHGFAKWVWENAHELSQLGVGSHFGEWWGRGIGRGYGLSEKRFSLFNTHRWSDEAGARPACCGVVPTLYAGKFGTPHVEHALGVLRALGSRAAPGFMSPEGVVVYHEASKQYFKKTILKDEEWKGAAQREVA